MSYNCHFPLCRTNKENALSREKSTVSKPPGKRPAWDLKGRLEDMEKKFGETMKRVGDLENEKKSLETDNEVKLEVVTQTTAQATQLQKSLGW